MEHYPTTDSAGRRIPNPSRPLTEGVAANDLIYTADSGHEQRRRKGFPVLTWELSYRALPKDAYLAIRAFYFEHTTSKAFYWTHPETKQQYAVRFASDVLQAEYIEHNHQGPIYRLSVKLLQVR